MSSPVKHFLDVLTRALRRARHFALVEGSAIPTKGSLVIVSGQNSVRPMHLFGHNFDHDYYFELLCEEERAAQSISRCSTAHHRLFRACPRANQTLQLVRNPIPCATSSTNQWRVSAPWPPWQSSGLGASSGGNTCCASSAIVGFSRSSNSSRSCRRRLAQGAHRNDSSCSRPCSRHNLFLQRKPSFRATACS